MIPYCLLFAIRTKDMSLPVLLCLSRAADKACRHQRGPPAPRRHALQGRANDLLSGTALHTRLGPKLARRTRGVGRQARRTATHSDVAAAVQAGRA